ncbi:MAG: restriction endonuclease subunit S [Gallionella sp.]|nr:restriction endonuclease subunit S [Gallionella sp.]MDD4945689.1 restriction endonuclease subunit S [Gallionella sp.]
MSNKTTPPLRGTPPEEGNVHPKGGAQNSPPLEGWQAKPDGVVPRLRFPEFREDGEWGWRQLGDFLNESRLPGSKGNVAKKITVKLWGNGVFEKNEAVQGSVNTQYFQRKAGQFIYSKLDFLNQAFGVIPENLDNFESTVDLPCFDIAEGLNSVFLLEYVKRKRFYERLGETADGSRKARRIHAETFLSFSVALPSQAEQQKIADCLSSLDELITLEAQKLATLKTHKKGLMQQLFPAEGNHPTPTGHPSKGGEFVPKLRFPEFQDTDGWLIKRLCEFADVNASGDLDSESFSPAKTDDHIYPIYSNSVTQNGLYGYCTYPKFQKDSVTVTARGTLGVAFYRDHDYVGIGRLLVFSELNNVIPYFLQEIWNYSAKMPLENGGIPQLTAIKARAVELWIPGKEEQQKIADFLSSLDDLITTQNQKLTALKTHKNGLMQQLFPSVGGVAGEA